MKPRHVVVCEKQSFLTASLERQFANSEDVNFRWTAYIADFFEYVENNTCDLAIIEEAQIDANSISRLSSTSQNLRILVIAPGEDDEFEDLLREIGVTSVIPSGTEIDRISRCVTKILMSDE